MNQLASYAHFAIQDALTFVQGPGDLIWAEIDTPLASARISVYAGQIVQFQPRSAAQALFYLSPETAYAAGRPIRGGIPVCWPWFGEVPTQTIKHGYARTSDWRVVDSARLPSGAVTLTLALDGTAPDSATAYADLALELRFVVADTLRLELTTHNHGHEATPIEQALHSYFRVAESQGVTVHGLDGCRYLDKLQDFAAGQQTQPLTITQAIDRIYLDTPQHLQIHDPRWQRRIHLRTEGSQSAIVWNPAEQAAELCDMPARDYHDFVCVETANVRSDQRLLAPGASHTLALEIAIASAD